jgi:type VI protein secretion system component Hcp
MTGTVAGVLYHQNTSTFTNVAQILGFNFSVPASHQVGAGAGGNSNPPTPVTLYKQMDIASPKLVQFAATNEVFQATIFAVESASG